jgi:hypothetical protein
MEQVKIAKQMVSFQKSLFENSFKAMSMVQDQTEQIVNTFLNQLPFANDEMKKSVVDSISFYKDARDKFKAAVDDGFQKLEEMFGDK